MFSLADDLLRKSGRHTTGAAVWWAPTLLVHYRPRVSVLVPALNEEQCLPHVLPRIPGWVDEVILIDGHSTDNTVESARKLRPDVRIVQQEGRGKGAALRSGIASATGDILITLDADASMDPAEIPTFVGALLGGADYVKGSRFLQGACTVDMPGTRRVFNWVFVKLANFLFGTHYTDITYGYNAVWRQHANALALEIDGWAHEIIGSIRAARNGLRVVEVASLEHPRIAGQAKLKALPAGWAILTAILCEPFRKPTSRSQMSDLQSLLPQSVARLDISGTVDGSYRVKVDVDDAQDGKQVSEQIGSLPVVARPAPKAPEYSHRSRS